MLGLGVWKFGFQDLEFESSGVRVGSLEVWVSGFGV